MQSGISRLAALLRAHDDAGRGELFCARVTAEMGLDDGRGIVIPAGDYLICTHADFKKTDKPALEPDMNILCAWADGQPVVIGKFE